MILGLLIVWVVVNLTKGLEMEEARCDRSRDADNLFFVHEGCR